MPLPVGSNGSGNPPPPPPPPGGAQAQDQNPAGDNNPPAGNGVRHRVGVNGAEYHFDVVPPPAEGDPAIAEGDPAIAAGDPAIATGPDARITVAGAVRLFFTSLSPMSQAGVRLPEFHLPSSRADFVAMGESLLGMTRYGTVVRGGRLVLTMAQGYRDAAREQARQEGAGAFGAAENAPDQAGQVVPDRIVVGPEVGAALTDNGLSTTEPDNPRNDGGIEPIQPVPVPEPEPVAPPWDIDLNWARRYGYGSAAQQMRQQCQDSKQQTFEYMAAKDACDNTGITPDALDNLNLQITCSPDEEGSYPVEVLWQEADGSYHGEQVECNQGQVIEVPRNARHVALSGGSGEVAGRVYVRAMRRGFHAGGSTASPTPDQEMQLLNLSSQLAKDGQWKALRALTENVMREVDPREAPNLTARMRQYHTEAERHIHHHAHSAAWNTVEALLVSVVATFGIYAAAEWYRGYRDGERGWALFRRPVTSMVRGFQSDSAGSQNQATRERDMEAGLLGVAAGGVDVDNEAHEPLGAAGGNNTDPEEDDWNDDEWFDTN